MGGANLLPLSAGLHPQMPGYPLWQLVHICTGVEFILPTDVIIADKFDEKTREQGWCLSTRSETVGWCAPLPPRCQAGAVNICAVLDGHPSASPEGNRKCNKPPGLDLAMCMAASRLSRVTVVAGVSRVDAAKPTVGQAFGLARRCLECTALMCRAWISVRVAWRLSRSPSQTATPSYGLAPWEYLSLRSLPRAPLALQTCWQA